MLRSENGMERAEVRGSSVDTNREWDGKSRSKRMFGCYDQRMGWKEPKKEKFGRYEQKMG
ncbi:hypothetical protein AKA01nite_04500 [Alkalibacterium kapii]|uniref:Uncharacterized protein n=1 Tax=Alkalibacterium kapii TaxID=426704 RepID=A0A511ARL0_9LACT|nr:hypothetical protein AKA01nite_04500 [Alkalibacterium kapii]